MLHRIAIGLENLSVISLGVRSFGKPPNMIHCIFNAQPTNSYPFCRCRQPCGIIPEELLCKMKIGFLTQSYEQFKMIKRAGWLPFYPAATHINYKTSLLFENTPELNGKRHEP